MSEPAEAVDHGLPEPLLPNPHYGTGRMRRRILLRKQGNKVIAELEDNKHAFRIRLFHDGKAITAMEGEAVRHPLNVCPGSIDLLQQLIGTPLSDNPHALGAVAKPRNFCTHLFDLASLALTHAARDEQQRQYDVIVEDERNGVLNVHALINDIEFMHWAVENQTIQNEGPCQGISIEQGFPRWVMANLKGDERETALVMIRTIFVANSRRIDISNIEGTNLVNTFMPEGICYARQEPQMHEAYHLVGTTKEYSDSPEQLLQFSEQL